MNKKIKIVGENNINNLGFETLLKAVGKRSKFTGIFMSYNKHNPAVLCLMPHIRDCEIEKFQNSAFKLYRKELPNGVITTSVRGIGSFDSIYAPMFSGLSIKDCKKQDAIVEVFLIDSATDEIKGYRVVVISERVVGQLIDDWKKMEYNNFGLSELAYSLEKYVLPFDDKEFMRRSQYIGRECKDITPDFVFFSAA